MDERRTDGKEPDFFQTAVAGTPPETTSHAERIALVIGSGGKGQTYLYWNGDQLFQLPVSYWVDLGWINSPGYRDGVAGPSLHGVWSVMQLILTLFRRS